MSTTAPKHPARYSRAVLDVMRPYLHGAVCDPMAGVGTLVEACGPDVTEIWLNELEIEWAYQYVGSDVRVFRATAVDAERLPNLTGPAAFDVVATSPTYGNRMADHHEAKDASKRITYRHLLGRPLHPANTGALQWGEPYQVKHKAIWQSVYDILKPGGLFLLNVSDHIRKGERIEVSKWHVKTVGDLGFRLERGIVVATPRMRRGANGSARVDGELVMVWRKP